MADGRPRATIRVLHVDDDVDFASLTADFLEQEDDRFEVVTETDPTAALDRLTEAHDAIDCVVSDYDMPGMNGLDFLRAVRTRFPDRRLPFVLLTGKGSEEVAAAALNAGASSYVQKGGPDTYEYLARQIGNDIESARAERNSARFFTLASALQDPVYVLDEEGRFTFVNDALRSLVGYSRGEILGSRPSLIKDDEAVAIAERQLGRILSAEGPDSVAFEIDIQPREGDPITCEDHMGVLPYEGESFQGSLGVLRDITVRKERERSLREAKEWYRTLVEQNLVGLYIARETELLYHNEPFARLFGHPAEANALAGESLLSFVESPDRERLEAALEQIEADRRGTIRRPYIGLTRDGEAVQIELFARGIELEGRPAVLGTVVDVDHEAELWQLRHERARIDALTSVLGRDLERPLSVVRDQLDLARGEELPAGTADALSTATTALDRVDELLADLLTFASAGEIVTDREPVDLATAAQSAWRTVETGEATLDVTATGRVDADASRLATVFENLSRNAVEHTDSAVTVRIGDLEDGFYVEHDGPRIPPEARDRVFEVGDTADGSGLGLAIVKEVVDAHGWQIVVTEGHEGGPRFEITAGEHPIRVE